MLSISTWNVNSVKARLQHLIKYLEDKKPDIVLLQELKCTADNFPHIEIENLGYNVAVHGQKTYNGVAILSKYPIEDITSKLPGDDSDNEARYIEGVISLEQKAIRIASVYVPNGQEPYSSKFLYKMDFFDRLHSHLEHLLDYEEVTIIGGDYNVAPENIDVFDPSSLKGTTCFHPDEQRKFQALLNLGYTDAYRLAYPQKQHFSWWDYRGSSWQYNKGMRIDHLLLSPQATDLINDVIIDTDPRSWNKPSDHTPVVAELQIT